MPRKTPTNILPWMTKNVNNAKNYDFYNSTRWRTYSIAYRKENPVCEVCAARGIIRPVIEKGKRVGVVDHVISINAGGSKFDENNHMAMCGFITGSCHELKRSLEGKKSLLIASTTNHEGKLIPVNKEDIITLLNESR